MLKSKPLRIALIVLGVLLVAVLGFAASIAIPFVRMAPPVNGARLPGAATLVVAGGSNVYILPSEQDRVILIDCGGDPKMTAVAAALKKMGLGLQDVAAVLITHAHPDHIAGCLALPNAEFYAETAEVPYVEGRAVLPGLLGTFATAKPTGIHIAHGIEDGEAGHLGEIRVVAFLVPGHTPGSAAYLINRVLYAGDAVSFDRKGAVFGAPWIFNSDGAQAAASVKALAKRLAVDKVDLVATGHTAPGSMSALK